MPTFTLHITGKASIPKLAEQANLRLSSSCTGSTKQSVADNVLATAKYIEDMIREVESRQLPSQESAVSHWSQTSLSTNSWVEYVPQFAAQDQEVVEYLFTNKHVPTSNLFPTGGIMPEQSQMVPVRRYRARIEFDVRFRDFPLLSEFSSHLTSLDHCEIDGLNWVLQESTEEQYRSQLRLKAAEDARAKVRDYCQVVCPGQDITIVPINLVGENLDGRLFAAATRVQPFNTGFGGFGASGGGLFANTKPSIANIPGQNASSSSLGADVSFAPQEIKISLSVDFIFSVETTGFMPSNDA